jgi:hypothetical protein
MFLYTIIKPFITLLENVNKSRTSAGRLSLNVMWLIALQNFGLRCYVDNGVVGW